MKFPLSSFLRSTLLSVALVSAAFAAEGNTAIQPSPRVPNDEKWMKRHESLVEDAKKNADAKVLFVGDSITDFWLTANPARGGLNVWNKEIAPLGAFNIGISADRTQHVLWRLENGEIAGLHPKAVVLMIGTNNTGFEPIATRPATPEEAAKGVTRVPLETTARPRNTPAEAAAGVTAIVKTLRAKLPNSKILLLAVFPRAEKPDHPQRLQVNEINAIISKLDDGKMVKYLDIGPKFLTPDGILSKDIMPDLLHPNEKGYEIWAAAIKEPLAALLK